MRGPIRSAVISGVAVAGVGALAVTPLAPPPEVQSPPTAVPQVRLAAASVPLGAIPAAFLRNQLTFCELICPSIVQLVVTVPIGAAESPVAFVEALQSGSLLKAVGAAAESVTAPADAATMGTITPDVFIVVPKAVQKALEVTVVQAINVGAAVLQPGGFIPAVETAREKILEALNQPATNPPSTLPTGAQGLVEVAAVEGINVADAIAFKAGELLLEGVVHTANVTATELANTGNVAEALGAGAATATAVVNQAGGIVADAVNTASTNILAAVHHDSASATTTNLGVTQPKTVTMTVAAHSTPTGLKSDPTKSGNLFAPTTHTGNTSSTAAGTRPGDAVVKVAVKNLTKAFRGGDNAAKADKPEKNSSGGKHGH